MHDISLHTPHTTLYLGAAILNEHIVYDKRHYFVRPATRNIDQSVPQLFVIQHDVTFELATCVLSFLRVEYGPVCDSLVFHQACQWGHFLGHFLLD